VWHTQATVTGRDRRVGVVGIDGTALESPAGGVRRYVRELLRHLAEVDRHLKLHVFTSKRSGHTAGDASGFGLSSRLGGNLAWCAAKLPLAVRRARVDVFHAPAYTAPLWGVHPLVLTIHDVSYARHPQWYPYRRDPLRRAFYRASARTADVIVTDSEFSRREIVAAYSLDAARIVVVPLGVGAPFAPGTPDAASLPPAVEPPYVLHVGDLHPRRNLTTAVRAVILLRRRHRALDRLRLVMAGADRGERRTLEQMASEAGHPEAVMFVGTPSDETLVALYRAAGALVYPSRYEGFGLPVLEAMACGTPVVAARAGALPEVVGSAAPLVDPDDEEGFARELATVLLDGDARGAARQRGLERAACFSWRRTAEATLAVYERCAGETAGRERRGARL
jgi:glycosyltransferase involved in cell wall biosynthesis